MERVCSRCHRKFNVYREDVDVCPDCLDAEFSQAVRQDEVSSEPGVASSAQLPRRDKVLSASLEAEFAQAAIAPLADEDAELSRTLKNAHWRQRERAVRMSRDLVKNDSFSAAGKIRFVFGLLVFGSGAFVFMLGSGEEYKTFINDLSVESQYVLAGSIAVVSAVLVMVSTYKYRWLRVFFALLLLVGGFSLPRLSYRLTESGGSLSAAPEGSDRRESAVARALESESEKRAKMGMRVLTQSDLDILNQTRRESPHESHVAVFMDDQESIVRDTLRDELTRLLQARQTHAYEEGTGYLYIVTGSACTPEQLRELLTRFGVLTYVSEQEGIYELAFDEEKAHLGNPYSSVTLTTAYDPSFVAANIYELLSPDSKRVARAAQLLADANVQLLRNDICGAAIQALGDPWGIDNDAYTQLVRLACVYSSPGNERVVELAMSYFRGRCSAGLFVPQQVVDFLIREEPDFMAEPVARLWAANPVAWEKSLANLSSRVEPRLLEFMQQAESISQINALLRFFQRYGTPKAIPEIERLLDHDDAIVRHTARVAIEKIRARAALP